MFFLSECWFDCVMECLILNCLVAFMIATQVDVNMFMFVVLISTFPTIESSKLFSNLCNISNSENIPFSTFILPIYNSLGLSSKGFDVFCNQLSSNSEGKIILLFFFANLFILRIVRDISPVYYCTR